MHTDSRLIDFNYFFSGYLSDAYWSSWLSVTHDLTVSQFIIFHKLYIIDDVASGIFIHAQHPHGRIDPVCLFSRAGHAIYSSIQAYPDVRVVCQDHVSPGILMEIDG